MLSGLANILIIKVPRTNGENYPLIFKFTSLVQSFKHGCRLQFFCSTIPSCAYYSIRPFSTGYLIIEKLVPHFLTREQTHQFNTLPYDISKDCEKIGNSSKNFECFNWLKYAIEATAELMSISNFHRSDFYLKLFIKDSESYRRQSL